MILSITESIETIRSRIATFTGENVKVGMPDDSEPGLFLFPYKFLVDRQIRNITTRERGPQSGQAYGLKCLLVPGPSIDYMVLSKGYDCLIADPLIQVNEGAIRVTISEISTENLTSLFISAGTTSRLSIPFEIHCSAT